MTDVEGRKFTYVMRRHCGCKVLAANLETIHTPCETHAELDRLRAVVTRVQELPQQLEDETWEGPQNGSERLYNAGLRHAAQMLSAALAGSTGGTQND
jgi:hypothetical protein